MTLKRFAGLHLNKRSLLIAALALAIIAVISVVPEMQRMVGRTHASNMETYPTLANSLNGKFAVQASGTTYFYTNPNGTTEVLHYTMAGTVTFARNINTAANLTLNLGGEDDNSSFGDYNELICYLTEPGDLFYTAGSGSTPAMLTVTSQGGDTCGNPPGVSASGIGPGNGGVSEVGKWIPFNFYPTSAGGLIVSNYTYLTLTPSGTTPVSATYPNGWNDSGSYGTGTHVAYGFSATGQLTPIVP